MTRNKPERFIFSGGCLLLFLFLLNSCSIEKRLYRPGFHVEWNENKGQKSEVRGQRSDGKGQSDSTLSDEKHKLSFQPNIRIGPFLSDNPSYYTPIPLTGSSGIAMVPMPERDLRMYARTAHFYQTKNKTEEPESKDGKSKTREEFWDDVTLVLLLGGLAFVITGISLMGYGPTWSVGVWILWTGVAAMAIALMIDFTLDPKYFSDRCGAGCLEMFFYLLIGAACSAL